VNSKYTELVPAMRNVWWRRIWTGSILLVSPGAAAAAGVCTFFYVLMSKYWDEMHEAKKDKLVLTGIVRFLQNNGAPVTSSEGSRIEG
jgi:hypothetical protein